MRHYNYTPDESLGLVFWLPKPDLWRIIDVLKHTQYAYQLFEDETNGWTLYVRSGRDLEIVHALASRALREAE
jgi:hypothetical protein